MRRELQPAVIPEARRPENLGSLAAVLDPHRPGGRANLDRETGLSELLGLLADALEVIDSFANDQGITRSAWIEQAAVRAARQAAIAEALVEYERESGRPITAREVESARRRIYGEPSEAS